MDDHVVVREGLRALLERQDDVHVIAEAGSVGEAVDLAVEPIINEFNGYVNVELEVKDLQFVTS